MPGILNVIGVGKETTRGSVAASALQMPIMGECFQPSITNEQAGGVDSASYPWERESVPMSQAIAIAMEPTFNVNTAADILGMALARNASRRLHTFSLKELLTATLKRNWLGCACGGLTLEFDRSGLMTARMQFEAMSQATGDGAAGTQPVGARFKLHASSFTLNSVAATKTLAMTWSMTTNLNAVRAGSGLGPLDFDEEATIQELTLRGLFDSLAWRAHVEGAADVDAAVTLATGNADEDIALAIAAAQVTAHQISGGGGIVEQEITLKPFCVDQGATPPVTIELGAGIGASQLSLTLPEPPGP